MCLSSGCGDLVAGCGALPVQVEERFDFRQREPKGPGLRNEPEDLDVVVAEQPVAGFGACGWRQQSLGFPDPDGLCRDADGLRFADLAGGRWRQRCRSSRPVSIAFAIFFSRIGRANKPSDDPLATFYPYGHQARQSVDGAERSEIRVTTTNVCDIYCKHEDGYPAAMPLPRRPR